MSIRAAVILAQNNRNMGMYSVDLSAFEMLPNYFGAVDFFVENKKTSASHFKYGRIDVLNYRAARQIEAYDKIILWGDFTSSIHYGRFDYKNVCAGSVSRSLLSRFLGSQLKGADHTFERWVNMYLPKKNHSYYSIGQNFQTMDLRSWEEIDESSRERYKFFKCVVARDSASYSAIKECMGSGSKTKIIKGCDVAFLCPSTSARRMPQSDKLTVGYFFGRARLSNIETLCSALSRRFRVIQISEWFSKAVDFDTTYQRAIEKIKQCDVIVTDTYHLIINALREGCPAIGLGTYQPTQIGTVGDFKKKVLFDDLGLQQYYVEVSQDQLQDSDIALVIEKVRGIDHAYWDAFCLDLIRERQKIEQALAV